MLERAIVINSVADFTAAELLARSLDAPVFFRSSMGQLEKWGAQEVYVLGKTEGVPGEKIINLSGANRFEVALNVYNLVKSEERRRRDSE